MIISKLSSEVVSCSLGAGRGIDRDGGVGGKRKTVQGAALDSGNSKEEPANSRKGDPQPPQHHCSVKRKESFLGSQRKPLAKDFRSA